DRMTKPAMMSRTTFWAPKPTPAPTAAPTATNGVRLRPQISKRLSAATMNTTTLTTLLITSHHVVARRALRGFFCSMRATALVPTRLARKDTARASTTTTAVRIRWPSQPSSTRVRINSSMAGEVNQRPSPLSAIDDRAQAGRPHGQFRHLSESAGAGRDDRRDRSQDRLEVPARGGDLLRIERPGSSPEGPRLSERRSEEHTSELQSRENLVC